MKKLLFILLITAALYACENQNIDFPDYKYTTAYFPYQYPVRVLVLGDYIYDNARDNEHKFLISAAFGGVYDNKTDRSIAIEVDESLCENVRFGSAGEDIRIMPASYYTLSSTDKIVIPAGQVNGGVEVQLTDAFFNDPDAAKLTYAIPLRITGSNDVDSILSGKSTKTNPDPRVASDWVTVPKDFTMFAVRYINPFDGIYLHRGSVTLTSNSGSSVIPYRTKYIEQNELWTLSTTGFIQVNVQGPIKTTQIPGNLDMLLSFADNGDITITENTGSLYTITGTGKFVNDGDEWGNKKRDAMYISYTLSHGEFTYTATDTLVIRDRNVKMELFTPVVFTP